MTNGEKFRSLFGVSAEELWCMNCDTFISRRDAIEAVTDYIFFDVYGGMKPVEKCKAEATRILCDVQSYEEKSDGQNG